MQGYYGLKLPDNLSEMQKKAEGEIRRIFDISRYAFVGHDVFMFTQSWSSTALGFGGVGGSAITTKYTTVFRTQIFSIYSNYKMDKDMFFYTVFFDGRFAYIIPSEGHRNDKIENDINRRNMKSVMEAKDYED